MLNFSPYATIRYLKPARAEQHIYRCFPDVPRTWTDVMISSFRKSRFISKDGWPIRRLRYLLYVWTSNVNQGQGAQVVLGGNLQYQVKKYFDIGAGIGALPTSRSLIGQWPFWLRQDARPMAEEFFRGSFTTGIWAQGEITKGLY